MLQLGVMTYGDISKQSPETQAAIEQEVRALLKVSWFFITPQFSFAYFTAVSPQTISNVTY